MCLISSVGDRVFDTIGVLSSSKSVQDDMILGLAVSGVKSSSNSVAVESRTRLMSRGNCGTGGTLDLSLSVSIMLLE